MSEPHDAETQTLRDLLALMHEHDLDRLKVKMGDALYELVRRDSGPPGYAPPPPPAPAAAEPAAPAQPVAGAHFKRVAAPLTGFFYRSPSPDAESFVTEGDRVERGDVLCIVEAMKLFNEIQSDYAGTIVRILPQNGELVSQGDELFWIEP
ncbi:MAG TPA: biotin/lipoyl-containing protein [Verrucomicrobiae bacterium]|nr:biotin/lipoyl-containing protein [Verrucomicrobiae bacterium]